MRKYFRPWNTDQTLLLPPNAQDFEPKGHVSRSIVELVRESLDLKEITGSYVSGLGQPPFDPRMMVALLPHGWPKRRVRNERRNFSFIRPKRFAESGDPSLTISRRPSQLLADALLQDQPQEGCRTSNPSAANLTPRRPLLFCRFIMPGCAWSPVQAVTSTLVTVTGAVLGSGKSFYV